MKTCSGGSGSDLSDINHLVRAGGKLTTAEGRRVAILATATTTEGFTARFTIHHMVEANHEAERVERIREACQRKYPKLARWKRDHGALTVMVFEENDIQLTNQQVVADALLEVEQTMPDRPDEVYLVSTATENTVVELRVAGRSA